MMAAPMTLPMTGGMPSPPMMAPPVMPSEEQIEQAKLIVDACTWEEVSAILRSDDRRNYTVDVETDATAFEDEEAEKQQRIEFLTAISGWLQQAIPAVQMNPSLGPLMKELTTFAVGAFKIGRTMEEAFEDAFNQIKDMPPQPNPDAEKAQAEMAMKKQEIEARAAERQQDAQFKQQERQQDMAFRGQELQLKREEMQTSLEMKRQEQMLGQQMARENAEFDRGMKVQDAQSRRDDAMHTRNAAAEDRQYKQSMDQEDRQFKRAQAEAPVQDEASLRDELTAVLQSFGEQVGAAIATLAQQQSDIMQAVQDIKAQLRI